MKAITRGASIDPHCSLAVLLCAAWWAMTLVVTRVGPPTAPDAVHTAVVARNLVHGLGNTIDWVPFHFGLRSEIRHVPEWHGVLQGPLLAALFAVFGVREDLIRVPGLTFAACTGLVAFGFARAVFGAIAGWLACLLTLSSAVFLFYGWAGTDDAGFAFFYASTLYLCYLGLTRHENYLRWAGWVGALALLEKQTGLSLPLVYVAVLCLARRSGIPIVRTAVWLLGPFALALGVYLLRNYEAYGGVAFRLGPLNWLYKAHGNSALYRFYDSAPRLGDVLASLGPERVAAIVLRQVESLVRAVVPRSPLDLWSRPGGASLHLLAIGIPSIVLHARRNATFFWLSVASVVVSVAFVCGLYSVERRYFMMLIPLVGVSLAGAVARGLQARGPGAMPVVLRCAAAGAALLIVAQAVVFAAAMREIPGFGPDRVCPTAFAWMQRHLPRDAVVLTSIPWWVSWRLERLAVVTPTGPSRDLRRVARHYGATWALLPPWPAERQEKAEGALRGAPLELDVKRVLVGDGCVLYRLRWRSE
jgi:hypothetical protein